jgi:amino acid efflux transporter
MKGMSMLQGAAVTVGAVLGTGVIALPALAARVAGPASLIAWVALVALSAPLAWTFAALGARYPDAGGVSTYVRRAFGARAAAVVGWSFYFAVITGAPAASLFGAAYVAAALGGGRVTAFATAAIMIVVVTAMNLGGVRTSGRAQLALATLLVVLLLAATVVALPHARLANVEPFAPHGWFAVVPAAAVLVWGFAGWEAVTALAADFRDPKRDLPRATAIAVAVIAVLYLGVAAASLLVLGPRTGTAQAPLAELLAVGAGGSVRLFTAAAAVVMTIGAMNAYFAGAAKLGAALGRDGALPAWLARGAAAGEVPRRSLGVVATVSAVALAVVSATGETAGAELSARLTTGCFVLVYVLGTAAAVRLLPRGSWSRRAAVVALACSALLLATTGWYLLWALAVAVAALLYVRRGGVRRTAAAPSTPPAAPPEGTRTGRC